MGAAKGGTTALAKWLSSQSEVFSPAIKEPSFFGSDIDVNLFSEEYRNRVKLAEGYFDQDPLPPVHMTFLREANQYNLLYRFADSYKYRVDASTVYLTSTLAAQEIFDYNPKAKIVVILRNPAYRAYSHYLMGVQMGLISTSFEKAWKQDLEASHRGIGQTEMLAECGMYGASLKRYYDVFPKDQICVLLHEEFNAMTPEFVQGLSSFLGMDISEQSVSRENTSSETKYKSLNKWIRNQSAFQMAKQVLSPVVIKRVKNWMTQDVSPLSDEMRQELLNYYQTDIEQTEALTGLDLTQWKK
ncbi:MAG: hypothetical protein SchgKO_08030 [Schleiferiaceae bacterium]